MCLIRFILLEYSVFSGRLTHIPTSSSETLEYEWDKKAIASQKVCMGRQSMPYYTVATSQWIRALFLVVDFASRLSSF